MGKCPVEEPQMQPQHPLGTSYINRPLYQVMLILQFHSYYIFISLSISLSIDEMINFQKMINSQRLINIPGQGTYKAHLKYLSISRRLFILRRPLQPQHPATTSSHSLQPQPPATPPPTSAVADLARYARVRGRVT
jgi:hypothetical protein